MHNKRNMGGRPRVLPGPVIAVGLRLVEEEVTALDTLAQRQGTSRGAAARQLVLQGLGMGDGRRLASKPEE
jgi:hypothetical protein